MDKYNFADLKSLPGSRMDGAAQLHLMREFDSTGRGEDVPDPYYGGKDGFTYVYELLDRSCENLLDHIKHKHQL